MPYALYTSLDDVKNWLLSLTEDNNEFAFELKNSGLVIGAGSIKVQDNDAWEIGYNLRFDYWRKGYTTEAAKALINWAYQNYGAREFIGAHATANIASGKVLTQCGFIFDHYGEYSRYDGSEVFPATYYKMTLI